MFNFFNENHDLILCKYTLTFIHGLSHSFIQFLKKESLYIRNNIQLHGVDWTRKFKTI